MKLTGLSIYIYGDPPSFSAKATVEGGGSEAEVKLLDAQAAKLVEITTAYAAQNIRQLTESIIAEGIH